jgi:hypothetical protein
VFAGIPGNIFKMSCIKFAVADVTPETRLREAKTDLNAAWEKMGTVLDFSPLEGDLPAVDLFDSPNMLAVAVYSSFYDHYPLRLGPDAIWLTIGMGFATYVTNNAEALRSRVVMHEGKMVLEVVRNDFAKGKRNDWASVFPEFAALIERSTVHGIRDLMEPDFTTTTAIDRVVGDIVLMEGCQKYFTYRLTTCCGIPSIELLGTIGDWVGLRAKVEALRGFVIEGAAGEHFGEWVETLGSVVDQFVSAAQGNVDLAFWRSTCSLYGGSRSSLLDTVSGWVRAFFPFDSTGKPWWAFRLGEEGQFVKLREFPAGLARAPVHIVWDDESEQDVLFMGGLTAVHQHPDGALEVRTGWGVVEEALEDGKPIVKKIYVRAAGH